MKNKRLLLIIVGAVATLGLLCLCVVVGLPVLLGPAVEETFNEVMKAPGENFIQALADKDYKAAFDLCTADLQAELDSPEGLAAMFSAMPDIESWTYETKTMEMRQDEQGHTETTRVLVFEGEVTFSNGQSRPLEIVLSPESETTFGGEVPYRVAGFSIELE
mgnify:CR=1 FL=1